MRLLTYSIITIFLVCFTPFASAEGAASATPQTIEQKLEKTRALMQENQLAHPAQAPATKADDDLVASSGIKMLQGLAVLVSLVLVGAWAYKKFVLKDTTIVSRKMKLLERITIAPRASLILTEVDGNKILVGLTSDGISMMKLGNGDSMGSAEAIELTEEYEKM